MLEACRFKSVLKSLNADRYAGLSDRELKKLLDKYLKSEFELLDWDAKKRKQCRKLALNYLELQKKLIVQINIVILNIQRNI